MEKQENQKQWVCTVNNPECFHGVIKNPVTGKFKDRCKCQKIFDLKVRFLRYAEAEEKLMKVPNQLTEKVRIARLNDVFGYIQKHGVQKGVNPLDHVETVDFKELLTNILENIEELIHDEARIFFTGNTECGKSQMASTILLGANIKEIDGFYLSATRFKNLTLSFKDADKQEEKQRILEKIRSRRTKILIIDDMGADIAIAGKHQSMLAQEYSEMIREFKGLVIVTSNNITTDLVQKYENMERMRSVLIKQNNMKEYIFDDVKLRQKEAGKAVKKLF
jgi:hypothetical protein